MIKIRQPIGGCRFPYQMSTGKMSKIKKLEFQNSTYFGLFLAHFYYEWFQEPNYVCYVSINM
jgi:hypothetical protein